MALSVAPVSNATLTNGLPSFQDMMNQTNPTGIGFGGLPSGTTTQTQPTGTDGTTFQSGGYSGTPQYGSTTPPPTTNNTGGTGTGGALSTAAGQGIYDAFQHQIGGLQDQYNSIPTYSNLDAANVNKDVDLQRAGFDQQYNYGQAQHQSGQQALDTGHLNGVRDLGDQLRGALSGYQNQLGVQGAGNSSAAGLLSYALQQQGNKGMNDLNTQYNQQQGNLNAAGSNMDAQYQQNVKLLEQFKFENLSKIATTYSQQSQQIRAAMDGAGTQEQLYLQNQNQTLAQQALQSMQALEGQVGNAHDQIVKAYANVQRPNTDMSQYANSFQVSPLSTQQIQSTSLANNQPNNNQSNINVPVSLQRRDNTQPF